MEQQERKGYYAGLFKNCDDSERDLVDRLIDEVIFYESQMDQMRALPFVSVNPRNPAQQRRTEASKLYKDLFGQYMNAIRILLNVLRKNDSTAADMLAEQLEEFML